MAMDREALVFLAKLTEQAERYDEMVDHMKTLVANCTDELTVEERNLFSVAYKNYLGARRASWRIISSIEDKATPEHRDRIKAYREEIAKEIITITTEVLALVQDKIIPGTHSDEGKVFYYKTVGDYYRYLAEVQVDKEREVSAERAVEGYMKASEIAMAEMPPTHPIRLGLALNFSVFYYDIMNSLDRASNLAKQAFDDAIAELDTLSEDTYRDSTLIMQLLRDNLTLWTSEPDAEGEVDPVN
ncbi:hypothetical protein Poli38472_014701 [Pythium oligandrum]|uniref:14-3-3 domain-containing protein n=1 Tax=Pythium oligandrum TaxID=41045 RepID=A0A8K1CI42_PYTOL|nr:hypothetical protein Poli38472_014701 [Pythium oligandrum]|eukprot:TMW63996.1 hypothetical protein Poli38472_014701 [Pythium oligandrum]